MTWEVANPDLMAMMPTRIQTVDVPRFPDVVDVKVLEGLDRIGLEDPSSRAWLMALATPRAAMQLHQVANLADKVGPRGLASIVRGLAQEKQLAVLRWQD